MDVTKLTPEQTRNILDFVLENSYHQEDYFDFKKRLLPMLSSIGYFSDEDEYLMKMVLNKLQKDGYVDFIRISGKVGQFVETYQAGEQMSIRRNFSGHIFIANGGYTGESQRKNAIQAHQSAYNARMETYSDSLSKWTVRLTYATWTAAAGAMGVLIWGMRHWIASLFSFG